MKTYLTNREINDIGSQQVYSLERKINSGEFSIESVGDYLPGNVLVNDLSNFSTVYMNESGCNILRQSIGELKELGTEYSLRFFIPEEVAAIVQSFVKMQQNNDSSDVVNYVQRVKAADESSYDWYFASAKMLYSPGQLVSDKVLLIVNQVNTLGHIAKKISSVLEESDWMKKNFKKFCSLTKREKEIITLLVSGRTSQQVSDILFISHLTTNTHRRNIADKLEVKSFAGLYKFAVTFGMVI